MNDLKVLQDSGVTLVLVVGEQLIDVRMIVLELLKIKSGRIQTGDLEKKKNVSTA